MTVEEPIACLLLRRVTCVGTYPVPLPFSAEAKWTVPGPLWNSRDCKGSSSLWHMLFTALWQLVPLCAVTTTNVSLRFFSRPDVI